MSSASIQIPSPANLAGPSKSESKPAGGPKPCCVCKDEKAARDECMLFSKSSDAQKDCASTIDKYRVCMAGFGFTLP